MSKLLDRLSELNRPPGNSEVPPDIRVKIAKDDAVRSTRKKYLLCCLISISAVLAGIGIRFHFEQSAAPPHTSLQPLFQQVTTVAPFNNSISKKPADVQVTDGKAVVSQTAATRKRTVEIRTDQPKREVVKQLEADTALPAAVAKMTNGIAPEMSPPAQAVDREVQESVLSAARTAEKRKAYGEALRIYMNALKTDPDNHFLLNNAAGIHIRRGEYGMALTLCEKALGLHRDYIPALINQGIARNYLGRTSEAAQSFAQALELDPTHKEAVFNLALFNEKTGKLDESVHAYQRLAVGGDVEGMIGLARVYEKQSRKQEAVKIYVDVASRRDLPVDTRNAVLKRLKQLEE